MLVLAGMSYELRVAGRAPERFATSAEAESRARELVRGNADLQIEIFDLETGQPYAPAASAGEREDMARKVGF